MVGITGASRYSFQIIPGIPDYFYSTTTLMMFVMNQPSSNFHSYEQ